MRLCALMPIQDMKQLYSEGGPGEVLRGVGRFLYYNTPVRDLRHSLLLRDGVSVMNCSVGDTSARFYITNEAELNRFDTAFGLAELSEQPVIESFLKDIEDAETAFDIGANVGTYTCLAGRKLDSGSIHAFEPHPNNIDRLRENIQLNDLTSSVKVHDYALSDVTGEFDLSVRVSSEAAEGSHSLISDSDIGEKIPVSTYRGDELIGEELPEPDLIKIDVEGAEFKVIKGLQDTISKSEPIIYCELHRDQLKEDGASANEVTELLTQKSYTIETLYERTSSTKFIRAIPE